MCRRQRIVPAGVAGRYVAEARSDRTEHAFRECPHRRHIRDERELKATLERPLGTERVFLDESALPKEDVRGDRARNGSEHLGRLGTLRCESRSLVDVAALQVNRRPRDKRIESRDLIALGGVSLGAAERPFGGRELTQARIGDREKPREYRRRERGGAPFELIERFAELLGALAQLAVEHHAAAHERFGDRVRAWIPQFFADRFTLLDRVLELRTRFSRLSSHPS